MFVKAVSLESLREIAVKEFKIPERVVQSICKYLELKGFSGELQNPDGAQKLLGFFHSFADLTGGMDYYRSNIFRYMYAGNDLGQVLGQIIDNTKYWIDLFGPEFFARSTYKPDMRACFMKASIDQDFYLSLKPSSGSGTFSLDFAIGIERGQRIDPTHEMWRTGIDTQLTDEGRKLRIIRTGNAMKKSNQGYEEKSELFTTFCKKYNTTPQRLLGILIMYIGRDLEVAEISAIRLAGARDKKLTMVESSGVNFDYDSLFTSIGFQNHGDPHWLALRNPVDNLYPTISRTRGLGDGVRRCEQGAVDLIIDAFRNLKTTFTAQPCPLRVCSNNSPTEILLALAAARAISNREQSSPYFT